MCHIDQYTEVVQEHVLAPTGGKVSAPDLAISAFADCRTWSLCPQATTLKSFNDVLAPVGVKVSAPDMGPPSESQWLVSDGRSLYRFEDGMVRLSDFVAVVVWTTELHHVSES